MKRNLYALLVFLFIGTGFTNSYATVIVPAPASSTTTPDPAVVKSAVDAFKSLSKKERKLKIKEVRKELKAFKAAKRSGDDPETNTVLLVILAILLPPLAVYLYEGEINTRFWISLLLTLLFWLPGIIYALVIILGEK
jgi:uncharacterized membrane protein YqaE (UPF0057 family)